MIGFQYAESSPGRGSSLSMHLF